MYLLKGDVEGTVELVTVCLDLLLQVLETLRDIVPDVSCRGNSVVLFN